MDRVEVPADIPPGAYVLSWRWDCEESAQVWQNCADVTIVEQAGDAAWDTASAAAIEKVPEPPRPKPKPKPSETSDACAAQVAFCEGKDGEIEGKCGATREETLAMCENNKKGSKTTTASEEEAKGKEQDSSTSTASSRVTPRAAPYTATLWMVVLLALPRR